MKRSTEDKACLIKMLDAREDELKNITYKFFKKFSRLEFALKKTGYVRSMGKHGSAQTDWCKFRKKFKDRYKLEDFEELILDNPPKNPKYEGEQLKQLNWVAPKFVNDQRGLKEIVRVLKAIRNNLFHGDKYSYSGWDDYDRTECLIKKGIKMIDKLACLDDELFENYIGKY